MSFGSQNNYSRSAMTTSSFPRRTPYAKPQSSKPVMSNKFSDRAPATFTTLKQVNFYEDEKTQMRATVTKINNDTFVGLNKMWRQPDGQEWLFSKKSFFMKVPVWRALVKSIPQIEQEVSSSREAKYEAATSYQNWIDANERMGVDQAAARRKLQDDPRTNIPMKFNVANNNVTRVTKPIAQEVSDGELHELANYAESDSPQSPQPLVIAVNVEAVKGSHPAKKAKLQITKNENADDDSIY